MDEKKVHQVLVILLDNTLKYISAGELIKIRLDKGKEGIVIMVADTGKGTAIENQEQLFDRFYREDESRNRETDGYGSGFAIAKEIVMKHRGKIYYQENFPKGSVFIIELPFQ